MSADAPIIHHVTQDIDLVALGVKPGWFVRDGCCTIWFEVQHVFEDMVFAAARNPKRGTNMLSTGDRFTSIRQATSAPPAGSDWLKLDRSNNFQSQ